MLRSVSEGEKNEDELSVISIEYENPCKDVTSPREHVQRENRRGPITENCGTSVESMHGVDDGVT